MDSFLLWTFALVGAVSVLSAGIKLLGPRRGGELGAAERNFVEGEERLLEKNPSQIDPYLRLMAFWCERGLYRQAETIFFRGAERFSSVEAFQAWGPRIFYGSYVGEQQRGLPAPPALDEPQSLRVNLRRKTLRLQLGRMLVSDLIEVERCIVDLRRAAPGSRRRWTYHVRRLEASIPEERLTAWLRSHVNLGVHDLTQFRVRFTDGRIEVSAVYRGMRVPIPFTVLFEIRAVERRHVKITVPRAPGLVGWLPMPTGRLLALLVESFAPPEQRFIRPLDDHSLLLSPFDPELFPMDLNLQTLAVEDDRIRIHCREDSEADDPLSGGNDPVALPAVTALAVSGPESPSEERRETGLLSRVASYFGRNGKAEEDELRELGDQGEPRKALELLDRRIRKNPLELEAWISKITILADRQERLWEALRVVGRALRHLPDSEELLLWQARLLARCERWDEAIEAYEGLVERRPEGAERIPFLRAMGQIHRQGTGNLDEARRIFEHVLKLDPAEAESLVDVSEVLVQQGELGRALDWLDEAIKVAPFDPIPYRRMAQIQAKRGRGEAARRADAAATVLERHGRALVGSPDPDPHVDADREEAPLAFPALRSVSPEGLIHPEERSSLGQALHAIYDRLGWIVAPDRVTAVKSSPLREETAPAFVELLREGAASLNLEEPRVAVVQAKRPFLEWAHGRPDLLWVSSTFFDSLSPLERRVEVMRQLAHAALGHCPFLAMGDEELELMAALLRHLALTPERGRTGWYETLHALLRGGVEEALRRILQGARSRRRLRQWIPPVEHGELHQVCRHALEGAPVSSESVAAWRRSLHLSVDRWALRVTGDLEGSLSSLIRMGVGVLSDERLAEMGFEALRYGENETTRRRIAELLRFSLEVPEGDDG